MKPTNISETIILLQEAVTIANPGMEVSISINMRPIQQIIKVETETAIIEEKEKPNIDLDDIRLMLNGYAKANGREKAFALVEKYSTDGSRNPVNVPPENYISMIKEIDTAEIDLSKQGSASA